MPQIDDDRLDEFIEAVRTFTEEAKSLSAAKDSRIVDLSKRARSNRRLIWVTIGSLILDVALTAAITIGGLQISSLTHRLDVSQTETRQRALCPLYQVFLDSKSKAGRDAAPDPKKYDKAFEVIQDGYDALNCNDFISDGNAKAPGEGG